MAKRVGVDVWARLLELDDRLAARGFPRISDWWRETLGAYYASRKRQLVLRVGRRGGKSSTLCRVAVAEALWGGHVIPPGDVGVFAIISVNKSEASERLRTIEEILLAMGMVRDQHFARAGDVIRIIGKAIVFKVFAANRANVRGFTCIGAICDELAWWRNEDTGANPADEILAALRPTMATVPTARIFLSSSPFSTLDAHHEAFSAGMTSTQAVAHAPTWLANPTVTEARTHELEPDLVAWTCEYKAEPISAGTSAFFDPGAIDAAIEAATKLGLRLSVAPQIGDQVMAGGDFGFRSDSSALAVCHLRGDAYRVADLLELRPEPNVPLKPSLVVKEFATVMKVHGLDVLMADGHYRESITEHLVEAGLAFALAPQGIDGNAEAFVRARVLLNSGLLIIPKHDRLIAQLKTVTSRPTAGGSLSIQQPRKVGAGGHGDLVSALVLAVYQKAGRLIETPVLKVGSPEWYAYQRSPERAQSDEDRWLEREEQNIRREQSGETPEWWDTPTSSAA